MPAHPSRGESGKQRTLWGDRVNQEVALSRAGSQSYPTPAATANDDGSTTVTFGPERPADSPEGNWIQTDPGKGWFVLLRLYSPLQPYFDKSWRPSEIEPV